VERKKNVKRQRAHYCLASQQRQWVIKALASWAMCLRQQVTPICYPVAITCVLHWSFFSHSTFIVTEDTARPRPHWPCDS